MQSSLAVTAFLMGLVGGPHCVAMCGAACAGIGRAAGARQNTALLSFQLGRIVGYSLLGGLAAASMQGLGWLTVQSAALRPLWSMFHVAATLLGLVLLIQARQPVWLEGVGRKVWAAVRAWAPGDGGTAPAVLGVLWALLPCGLLYSALLVAALANSVVSGAAVMALFALGTSITMTLGPWAWLRLRGQAAAGSGAARGDWGVRLAGAALAASSGWALWMGLMHNTAPWCAVP
ncbi:MAG: sulfite exporter TauE/SafE family protein [Burkholderiales bacterium]|nr:sulfite exporter TauE/SafE family protein [Burkholderiales bacterium]